MKNINYLLKLNHEERKQLLENLGFKFYKGFMRGTYVGFGNDELFANAWDHNYEKPEQYLDIRFRLNDFKLIEGFNDPKKSLQKKYYSYMIDKFGENYKTDCKVYLEEQKANHQDSASLRNQEITKDIEDTLNCLE